MKKAAIIITVAAFAVALGSLGWNPGAFSLGW